MIESRVCICVYMCVCVSAPTGQVRVKKVEGDERSYAIPQLDFNTLPGN